ncbi:MAG TPA: glycosyl hydrolase [Mucilaginibacter sp.]|nr:glycosyl hydrolase [Mucilaginibacter sp.]
MMKHAFKYILLITLLSGNLIANAQTYAPCDNQATKETRWLFSSMQRLIGAGVMFGHHDDSAYGVGWKFDANRSDVKSVTGAYPSVYGWDLAKLEHDSTNDINGIPFKLQKKLVEQVYARGGINTYCWHMDNPANGKSAWDTTQQTVKELIPGGAYHKTYIEYLDKAAKYLANLKGSDGEAIPILFRPFHELTGNWFWWCKNTSSPEDFKTLWRFTIDYMRNTKKLHNLLIVFSVADFDSEADFMERYPGDKYVDFIGFDNYCTQGIPKFVTNLDKRLALLDVIAAKHHKVSCLAETGFEGIPSNDWWTKVLLPVLSKYKTSYVLMWRNANTHHFYAPYPGQQSEADFKQFFNSNQTLFQNRLTPLSVYGKYMNGN